MRWYFILRESWQSAYRTVTLNKLRTFLSLLGVTIGIFSMISVFTVLDSMESNMRKSIESFGTDVVVVEKWPWVPEEGKEFAWWEYINRPLTKIREYEELKQRLTPDHQVCFMAVANTDIEYLDNKAEGMMLWGASEEFGKIRNFDLSDGRYLSDLEINSGKNSCVIGHTIAEKLLQGKPLGKIIRVNNWKLNVIGVFAQEGKSILGGGSMDKVVMTSVVFMSGIIDLKQESANPQIWVKAAPGMNINAMKQDIRMAMRSIRRLGPKAKDNFALNKTSLMSSGIDQIFKVVNIAGGFIGIFSILVGAFGIANIMFISVKERTNIIGIQKAMGAKSSYIIIEVLNESVLLSIIGGIIGILLIYAGTFIARAQGFEISLQADNIILGLIISNAVGIIAGLLPALTAARLDPVKAINSTF
jgi:putative ABC transport system permease protein